MRVFGLLLVCVLAIAGCVRPEEETSATTLDELAPTTTVAISPTPEPAAPAPTIAVPASTLVVMDTSHGVILLQLRPDAAPATVANFLALARDGFYDGTRIHRVVGPAAAPPEGFYIQGGDPLSRRPEERERWGYGGSEANVPDEYALDAAGEPLLRHDRAGVLGMANRGPGTANSQFYITLAPAPGLDGKNAVFGRVVGGLEVVKRIGMVEIDESQVPLEDVVIHAVSPT